MDKVEKARELFEKLESRSVKEVVERVKRGARDINQEALRRFRVQQRLDEIKQAVVA